MVIVKAQEFGGENMVHDPLRPQQLVWLYTAGVHKLFLLTTSEMKDDIKWMNEKSKWHEERGLKIGEYL